MEGRFYRGHGGGGGGGRASMVVICTQNQELALTNRAYVSLEDIDRFPNALILVANTWVFTLHAHHGVPSGHIALNAIQRRQAKVSAGDSVTVSSFSPPDDFKWAPLTVELEYARAGANRNDGLDPDVLAQQLRERFHDQIMTSGQMVAFEFKGTNYVFTVKQALLEGQENSTPSQRGFLSIDTDIIFVTAPNSGIQVIKQTEAASNKRSKMFKPEEWEIGGLSEQTTQNINRAIVSRVQYPQSSFRDKFGIEHFKGILLHGHPGTGKSLTARQIGKFLNGKNPKIVNGSEISSNVIGETEKNVRNLFADAEAEQKIRGDQSDLHVIIIENIDAICKSSGSTRHGTGAHNRIVSQLLAKIDGAEALNNVLLIGTTNDKDLLDKALLRPGRLEVHIEINLPDENGRLQILEIHTNKWKGICFLSPDVNLLDLVARTEKYSGAELERIVKSAVSSAVDRLNAMGEALDVESIKVTMDDFLKALETGERGRPRSGVCNHQGLQMKVARALVRQQLSRMLNHLDNFSPPSHKQGIKVARLQMDYLTSRLAQRGITLTTTNAALEVILSLSHDPKSGTCPIRRWIQEHVETKLSEMLSETDKNYKVYIDATHAKDNLDYKVKLVRSGGANQRRP